MEKGEVEISPAVLEKLGAKPTPYIPIERQPDPRGLNQDLIEKALSPRANETFYNAEIKLTTPGSKG
jgi:hypothetical protein